MPLNPTAQAILADPNLRSYLMSPEYAQQWTGQQDPSAAWISQVTRGLLGRDLTPEELTQGVNYLQNVGYDPIQFLQAAMGSSYYTAQTPEDVIRSMTLGVTGAPISDANLAAYYQRYTGQPYQPPTTPPPPAQPPPPVLQPEPPQWPGWTPVEPPVEPPVPTIGAPGNQPDVPLTSSIPWGIPNTMQALGDAYSQLQYGRENNPFTITDTRNSLAQISSDLQNQQAANPFGLPAAIGAYSGVSENLDAQQAANPFGLPEAMSAYGGVREDLRGQQAANPYDIPSAINAATSLYNQQYGALSPFFTGDLGNSPATQAAVRAFEQNTLPVIQHQMELQGLGGGPSVGAAAGQALATALPGIIQNDLSNRMQASQMFQPWSDVNLGLAGLGEQQQGRNLQEAQTWNQAIGALSGLGEQQQGRNLQEAGLWNQAISSLMGASGEEQNRYLQQAGLWNQAALGLGQMSEGQQGRNLQEAQTWGQLALGLGGQAQTDEQLLQSAAQMSANIGNQEAMRQLQAMQTSGNLLTGLYQPLSALGGMTQQQQQLALQAFQGAGGLQRDVTQQTGDAELMDWLRRQGLAESSSTGLFGSSVVPPSISQMTKTSGGK